MAPSLYWRKLARGNNPDEDFVADAEFLATNFVDFFGKWLQQGTNAQIQSHDGLVLSFWEPPSDGQVAKFDVQTFMVADGGFVDRTKSPASTWDWFKPMIRFLTLIQPTGKTFFSPATTDNDWTLCIVGGSRPKQASRTDGSFLQVASWNGKEFRFYQSDFPHGLKGKEAQAWNYLGQSKDAFGPNAYLGPFNGHVNGAVVMKEIHKPWLHWLGEGGQFDNSFTSEDKNAFREVTWLTSPGQQLLSLVNSSPDSLEGFITTGISNWFNTRQSLDFGGSQKLLTKPANIQRWAAHLFLTTTINLGSALSPGVDYTLPPNHLYNLELLQSTDITQLMIINNNPRDSIKLPSISFKEEDYTKAATALKLSLFQQVGPKDADVTFPWYTIGGPGPTEDVSFKILAENFEGPFPFNIIQPSVEDSIGVQRMQKLKRIPQPPNYHGPKVYLGLFSPRVFSAIVMVDFWNPVYSWRRGCLMQYVPLETTFDGTAYNLEGDFIAAVKKSPYAQDQFAGSPEHEFLRLLDVDVKDHQTAMLDYIAAVAKRMEADPVTALTEHLTLAESRRRIFRPLPLDEFGPSLPFALALDPNVPLFKEMRPDGTIQDMPQRGVTFLKAWTYSLAGFDPNIIPEPNPSPALAPVSIQALPPPANLSVPCQRAAITGGGAPSAADGLTAKACTFSASKTTESRLYASAAPQLETATATNTPPNWTDNVLSLITSPHWVSGDPKATGERWIKAMQDYGAWSLDNYDDVKERAVGIYQHLRTKAMPITRDPQDFWPEAALEIFRQWANAGFPKDASDSPSPDVVIPKPVEPRDTFKVRRDIMSLTKDELAQYQAKLDDVLQVDSLHSPWQDLCALHVYWCLHYQEATFLWHRAYLLRVERLIGMPIPYWNGHASETPDPKSPYAGIPPMFLEETYVHPADGSLRPNPLKYALALGGKSKAGKGSFVTRDPTLVKGPSDPDWGRKIALFSMYHEQINHALGQGTFTSGPTAEGFGRPWANITTFSDDQSDSLYPWRCDFDGLFEQVHDNFHGWVGPDMADNTYTACDPIFLSYHANMDRLAGIFLDTHPEAQYTSNYPLQPFMNSGADVSYDDPRRWKYTTIGDMAKDTRCLGYEYGRPVCADGITHYPGLHRATMAPKPSGGRAITLPADILEPEAVDNGNRKSNGASANGTAKSNGSSAKKPYVIFSGVGCTESSYRIEVFAAGAKSLVPDAQANPDFVGEVTRIGMGPGTESRGPPNAGGRRCRQPLATRVLPAERVRTQLEKQAAVQITVTRLDTGEKVDKVEYEKMPGFIPRVVWLSEEGSM